MRLICFLAISVGLAAEPLPWIDLTAPVRALFRQAGMAETDYPAWQDRHSAITKERLAAGAAEHISYYLLQSAELTGDSPLDPAKEARGYLHSLPAAERQHFLSGANSVTPVRDSVRRRIDAFWNNKPVSERHRLLREMAKRLDWTPERVIFTAFRFLMRRSIDEDPTNLYQARGLSADPFPPSMRAVDRGLAWLRANRAGSSSENIFLAGPGAEFGSRFGVDDTLPVISPQPKALLALLPKRPLVFDCADIRREVVATLKNGPCRASQLDLVTEKIQGGPYDLAVATNLLVYLDDLELAAALSNLSLALKPEGCLLHNDSRFAAQALRRSRRNASRPF